MKVLNKFSIIELMTVVLIVLLLMSLTIPIFVNLKLNARTIICKNNLRQMGVLITSYQSNNGSYLPNDESFYRHSDGAACGYVGECKRPHIPGDIPFAGGKTNNSLYQNWNGHLIPYLEVNLPDKYTRYAMVTKVCTRSDENQLGGPANPPPKDSTKNGWAVVEDAYRIGGYNDLRLFICPEMHSNNFDVATSNKFNGIQIPRISQLITNWTAFADLAGWGYGMAGALPSTYQANETFFGSGVFNNSFRIDQISEISNKVLILEGKGATSGLYYGLSALSGSDSFNKPGWDPNDPGLSFVHDNTEQFWVMQKVKFDWTKGVPYYMECANRFNTNFAGKAYMVYGFNQWAGAPEFSIVSYVFPGANGDLYNSFLKAYDNNVGLMPFTPFIDEPNEYKYLVGNTNVLFGDGSVATKDQPWLFNNRERIAAQEK